MIKELFGVLTVHIKRMVEMSSNMIEHDKFGEVCMCGCHNVGCGLIMHCFSPDCCDNVNVRYWHDDGVLDEKKYLDMIARYIKRLEGCLVYLNSESNDGAVSNLTSDEIELGKKNVNVKLEKCIKCLDAGCAYRDCKEGE